MAKRMPTAASAAAKWKRQMAAAGQAYEDGVNSVDVAPTAQAADSIDRMVSGMAEAAADGRIERGLRSVSLADWKKSTIEKGKARLSQGAAASEDRTRAAMEENFRDIEEVRASLPPRGTLQDNIARMTAYAEGMAAKRRARA